MTNRSENRLTLLVNHLNQAGVRHTIFKGVEGERFQLPARGGDIDLLIDESETVGFTREAAKAGFFNDATSPVALGTHVSVWRAFDPSAGRFTILHVHLKLCVSHNPPLRLGIEELVLRQSSLADGIRMASSPVRILLSQCFKLLASKEPAEKVVQYDDPDVRVILDSLVENTEFENPTNSRELVQMLSSVAPQYASKSDCGSNAQAAQTMSRLKRRLFPRNKLGEGLTLSVHTDGSPNSEESIKLTQNMMSEMMRTRTLSDKAGVLGPITGSLAKLRSAISKRRGYFVLYRETRPTRRSSADLTLNIKSLESELQLEFKSPTTGQVLSSAHSDPRSASIEITDRLVRTLAPQNEQ